MKSQKSLKPDNFRKEALEIFDQLPKEAHHEFANAILSFSCVPYRPVSTRGCVSCTVCWLEYMRWLQERYSK